MVDFNYRSLSHISNLAKSVGNAVIVDPLTAGSARDPHDPRGHGSDGKIAATVTTTCLTSIGFVLVAIFQSERLNSEDAYITCLIIILGIAVIAIFSMLWISVVAHLNTERWLRNDASEHKDGLKISITFLWVFGMASVVQEALELTVNVSCLDFQHELNTTGYKYRWYMIGTNTSIILFYCVQLSFVSFFIRYRLGNYISINYGLLFVLTTNAVLWFISEKEEVDGYYDDEPGQAANRTQDPCYWNSNITMLVSSSLNPYLSPASIEFFLLSSGLILAMIPKHTESNALEEDTWSSEEMVPLIQHSETQPLLKRPHHPVTHFSFIILVIVFNLTLLTGNIVFVFVLPRDSSMFCTWIVIDSFYKLVMVIVIMLIYYHIYLYGKPKPGNHQLKPGQYILLIATTGTVAVCVFGMIGGIQVLDPLKGFLYTTDNTFDIIIAFLQTILLIHIERVNLNRTEEACIPTDLLCIFLAICNMSYWIVDSFIDVRYAESYHITGPVFDKENWEDVQDDLAPMLIFYRFHAFLDWYIIYCKLRRV